MYPYNGPQYPHYAPQNNQVVQVTNPGWHCPPAPQPVVIVQAQAKPPFGHGIHCFLDIVTCGAWLPFHFLAWLLH